jgi:hypothetical protein
MVGNGGKANSWRWCENVMSSGLSRSPAVGENGSKWVLTVGITKAVGERRMKDSKVT